jgi:segregation and condensation protein A
LNVFEGPFDLLVYLIENAEMSIYDIRISEITSQYLDYIAEMKQRNVVVGAEFLILAATLIDIKSKMLLPRIRPDGEMDEDPRSELAEKLAEYTRFKKLAAALELQMEIAALKLSKPMEDLLPYTGEPDIFLKMEMDSFTEAFKAFLYKRKKNEELFAIQRDVGKDRVSVSAKKRSIRSLLFKTKEKFLNFKNFLAKDGGRYDKVTTFVSLMDMAKSGQVTVRQQSNYGDIMVAIPKSADSGE